jgi:hypothetical protein
VKLETWTQLGLPYRYCINLKTGHHQLAANSESLPTGKEAGG